MPLISIIIPVFNSQSFVVDTLISARQQSHKNIEILIVNDGSTDKTVDKIMPLLKDDERIKLFSHSSNKGIATARNTALKNSKGNYLAFLDADDLWEKDKLRLQIKSLAANPDAGLTFTASRRIDQQGKTLDENICQDRNIPTGRITGKQFIIDRYPIITSSVMITRQCLNQTGLFNHDYESAEDFDFWLRILQHHEQCYIPAVLTSYRSHSANTTKNILINRKSKVKVLEDLLLNSPKIIDELGVDFRVYLHRQYLGLTRIYKRENDTKNAQLYFKKAQLLDIPMPYKIRAKLLKFRYI